MIEVICNDRLGKKVRVKVNEDDTIGDLKKLIAAQVKTIEKYLGRCDAEASLGLSSSEVQWFDR
jgi:hypothetical protein